MGRKKKTNEGRVCPPYEESTGVEETDTEGANPKVGVRNQEGKDLAKGPKTSTIIDGKTKDQCDQNEKYDRKSLKDLNHKRSLFGRRRLPSESPRRRDHRKQGAEEREGQAEAVVANGKIKKASSNERMSRRDIYFADKPERDEGQATKVTEIYTKATVDSSDEEIGHGRQRKSRRDMVNSTHFRRRLLSKSPFKIPQRCPLQGCWKGSKDSSKGNKESKNGKQVELEVSYKKDNTTQQPKELHINTKPECKLTKEKKVQIRRRQRTLDATKGPQDETNVSAAALGQGKSKSKVNITNCCWKKSKKSKHKKDSESTEEYNLSKVNTFPTKSTLETNETDTASSVLKKNAAVDKSSDIGPDIYPEELNPFAEETVSKENEKGRGTSVISEGGTTKPTEDSGTNFAQPKTVDNKKSCDINQDEYPDRLNPFAGNKDRGAGPTQPKEQGDSNTIDPYQLESVEENVPKDKSSKASNDRSIVATDQKSKLHLRWKNRKARRCWASKNVKHATKVDINRPKSNISKDKSSVSTVGTKNDSTEKQKKRRNWWSNWKSLKTRRCKLSDKKTKYMDVDQTQSNNSSDKHNTQKSVSSFKTSDANLPGAIQKKKKTWRSRLNIRKKKTHKHQSESAVQITKCKRTKQRWWYTLRRTQKKLSQEKNEDMTDEKVPEIVEDDKSVYKSKHKKDSESTEEYNLSKVNTFPTKSTLETNETDTASSVLKKNAAVGKSSDIGPDNYPEELNPFAEETVSKENEKGRGTSVISKGGTTKPTEENVTNFAQPKTVDNKKSCDINQDEYPDRLNPFAGNKDREAGPTQPKEQGDSNTIDPYQLESVEENVPKDKSSKASNDRSIVATGQKSKLHLRWKNRKARRYWASKNVKHATKVDINRPKSNISKDKSSVSTVGTKNDSTEKQKKRRNWWSNWKSLKTRRCKLTDKKTKYMDVDQTQSNNSSDKHNTRKSVSSFKTSDANLPGAIQKKKKKTWRSRLNIRKKKTHKHQSESAVQITKCKRTKQRWWYTLRRTQKKLSQEKNEDMTDEKVPEIVEDDKSVYKSKHKKDSESTEEYNLSKVNTFPTKSSLETNETDTASSVLKKNAAVGKSSDIGPDNYPEELNPFAEETVSKENEKGRGTSVISKGGTTKPTEENVTNFAQPKTVDNKKSCDINQDEYPDRLNPFAGNKDREAGPTQPKEQGDSNTIDPYQLESVEENVPKDKSSKASNDRSIVATGQKSKLHFRWKNLKARRYWKSKNVKHATKVDINRPKSNIAKDKSSVSTVGTKNDSTEKQKKRRNWWSDWKSLKTRRCKLTDKKTKYMDVDQTQSNTSSDKHNTQKSVSSFKTSDANLHGAIQKKKKTWRSKLNIRKKKTHKHQSESAVQITKCKRTKKRWWYTLRRTQKKLSQEKNEDMTDEKVPEIVEDDKSVYKSKYLQNLNPQTAAQFKSSIKERRVPSWKIESKSDIKIKQRRWWRIRKRHRSRDIGENDSQKDEMKSDKVDRDSDGKERTDFPKKKMTIFKKFKNVVKSRNKNLSSSNCESATVVSDPNPDNEKKSPTKLKSKHKSDSKGKNSSSEEKTGRKDLSDHKMDRNLPPALTKLRKSWKRFNQWLDE